MTNNSEVGSQQDNVWIDTARAARILGCSRSWIAKLLRTGKVEGRRVGMRMWLVHRESLLDYNQRRDSWRRR